MALENKKIMNTYFLVSKAIILPVKGGGHLSEFTLFFVFEERETSQTEICNLLSALV